MPTASRRSTAQPQGKVAGAALRNRIQTAGAGERARQQAERPFTFIPPVRVLQGPVQPEGRQPGMRPVRSSLLPRASTAPVIGFIGEEPLVASLLRACGHWSQPCGRGFMARGSSSCGCRRGRSR